MQMSRSDEKNDMDFAPALKKSIEQILKLLNLNYFSLIFFLTR
jgi:hypothetical protein